MIKNAEKVDGYKIEQVTRVSRDFLETLPCGISEIFKPIVKAGEQGKKLRIVIDYDPQKEKTEFRYYFPI